MGSPIRISDEHYEMVTEYADGKEEELGFRPTYKAIVEGAIEEYVDKN